MRPCAIEGCELEGVHVLGVRCRKTNARALWAPNAAAGLCEKHARAGVNVELRVHEWPLFNGVTVECAGTARLVPFSEAVAQ